MTEDQALNLAERLFSDIKDEDSFPNTRPLLAHYTSIENLEKIVTNDEFWFSNPLFMNDHEELRFGISQGAREFHSNIDFKNSLSPEIYSIASQQFENHHREFTEKNAFDVYVLCFSQHENDNDDGLLSMWRGYGKNGSGALMVIDTNAFEPVDESPVMLAKVEYLSTAQRSQWIQNKLMELSQIINENSVPTNCIHILVANFFERLKIFSLFTKHHGFKEEREWRAVYIRERDDEKILDGALSYAITPRGVEPKLKLKIHPIENITPENFYIETITNKIILGPMNSTLLATTAVKRMLENIGKTELAKKVFASSTPYRAN